MQKPSIGRIVVVKGPKSNGQDEHPAIVNCVHSVAHDIETPELFHLCNTTMFPDCGVPMAITSVYVFQNREQAIAWRERNGRSDYDPNVAFFPDRESEGRFKHVSNVHTDGCGCHDCVVARG